MHTFFSFEIVLKVWCSPQATVITNNIKQNDCAFSSSSPHPWVLPLGAVSVHWAQEHTQHFAWHKCLKAGVAMLLLISNEKKKYTSGKYACFNLQATAVCVAPMYNPLERKMNRYSKPWSFATLGLAVAYLSKLQCKSIRSLEHKIIWVDDNIFTEFT